MKLIREKLFATIALASLGLCSVARAEPPEELRPGSSHVHPEERDGKVFFAHLDGLRSWAFLGVFLRLKRRFAHVQTT